MGWVRTAAALCALIVVATPASAAGKAPRSFYRVASQGRLDRTDFERMSRGRAGTLRVPLAWAQINRTAIPADYDWSTFDATVGQAARHGIAVLPIVYTVPVWVSVIEGCDQPTTDSCAISPPHTTLGLSAWRSFLGAAVGRYGPGGLFWTLHPELSETPIRAWQIWNEQNDPGFSPPASSATSTPIRVSRPPSTGSAFTPMRAGSRESSARYGARPGSSADSTRARPRSGSPRSAGPRGRADAAQPRPPGPGAATDPGVSLADARCLWCAPAGLFPVRSLDHPKPAWASFLSFTGGS